MNDYMDQMPHMLRFTFANRPEGLSVTASRQEAERIRNQLLDDGEPLPADFIGLDDLRGQRYYVRRQALAHCQILWEPMPVAEFLKGIQEGEETASLRWYFEGETAPPIDAEVCDPEQLKAVTQTLDLIAMGDPPFLSLIDEDGEHVIVNLEHVVAVRMPLMDLDGDEEEDPD